MTGSKLIAKGLKMFVNVISTLESGVKECYKEITKEEAKIKEAEDKVFQATTNKKLLKEDIDKTLKVIQNVKNLIGE